MTYAVFFAMLCLFLIAVFLVTEYYSTKIFYFEIQIFLLKCWTEDRIQKLSESEKEQARNELGKMIATKPSFSVGRDWYRSFFCNKK